MEFPERGYQRDVQLLTSCQWLVFVLTERRGCPNCSQVLINGQIPAPSPMQDGGSYGSSNAMNLTTAVVARWRKLLLG